MKVRSFTKTGPKGQVVIPKKMREALHISKDTPLSITLRDGGIYMAPVEEFIHAESADVSYGSILQQTKGKLASGEWDKLEKKRATRELEDSKRRKTAW